MLGYVYFQDTSSSLPIFHQAVFSSATKPIPLVAALVSFISYSRNPVWSFSMLIDFILCPPLGCFSFCVLFHLLFSGQLKCKFATLLCTYDDILTHKKLIVTCSCSFYPYPCYPCFEL